MFSLSQAPVVILAVWTAWLSLAPTARTDEPSTPHNGVLVLRNGNVVAGQIAYSGDAYLVSLPGDGEIRLTAEHVKFECRDLEEAYDLQLAAMTPHDANSHLRLASWCLRQGLHSHASEQLRSARALDEDHPVLDRLQRQLELTQQPVTTNGIAAESSWQASKQALDNEIAELPHGTVEVYTGSVQPLLLNSCAATNCHGARSQTGFQLRRNPWRGGMTRPFTLRNLAVTLEYVNRKQAEKSRILKHARQPHGENTKGAHWQFDDQKFELLRDWVFRAAGTVVVQPQSFQLPDPQLAQRVQISPEIPRRTTDGQRPSIPQRPIMRPRRLTIVGSNAAVGSSVVGGDDLPNTAADTFRAQDSFDAEIFNRRFHGAP